MHIQWLLCDDIMHVRPVANVWLVYRWNSTRIGFHDEGDGLFHQHHKHDEC